MPVESGHDYVFVPKFSWAFKRGVGKAMLVVTRQAIYAYPYHEVGGGGLTTTKTDVSLGGRHPLEAIRELLAAPETTPEQLDATLERWCGKHPDAIVKPLGGYKRIKIRTGLFRMVGLSEKEKGLVSSPGTTIGLRPTKQELADFIRFFEGDPRLV